MSTDFTPIYPHFYEIFEKSFHQETSRIIYFGEGIEILETKGKTEGIFRNEFREEFLKFHSGILVRIDRIISINGIPGPAFDEYDRYATACLDCNFEVNE